MNSVDIIQSGRRVICTEAEAMTIMASTLDEHFVLAAKLILERRGKVVVSGIGKSGHVGRKIAATLASTGTPETFVHPAEANHGDLGMITSDDVLLMISNSGETTELLGTIAYAARFSVPIVAITREPGSTLGRVAAARLLIPRAQEACALGLAPTTSTTCTLALGDALAVALMELRDFGAEDFGVFHPGGPLGARLLRARDLMHPAPDLPLVTESRPMSETLLEMTRHSFGIVGVTSDRDGELVGVISDGDLRRHMTGLLENTAAQIMTRSPRTILSSSLAAEALLIMNRHKITSLFVTGENGDLVGLLHIHDCLRAGLDITSHDQR
jgi:arabinose-5-phosphate isomerase